MVDEPQAPGLSPASTQRTAADDIADDIAIVGIGCRFPEDIRDLGALWRVFLEGVNMTGEIPADRWGPQFQHPDPRRPGTTYCPKGAFLDDVDKFDADFFGIAPREARELDPQQRLLLETSWAAMEDSGIPRQSWEGSRTGVFTGVLAMDYAVLHAKTAGVGSINPYYASGKEFSFGAGRIAYTFGLHGPCLMLNTACSSSLMAVHLGCQSLRNGECDAALAGGVNLMLAPELSVFMSKIDALSPTGVCRPFDTAADGVVRGEGCAVVVLKRYTDAVADRDRIWAVVKGSAVNHDGRSAGLTAPNAAAQQMLLRSALDNARVDPADIDYVEAHCTGTPLGDPLEVSALTAAIGSAREPDRPLLVGSHKANFGHLDSAAGILGLLKGVLVARHGVVPPQIHLNEPTAAVDWEHSGIRVPTAPTPLRGPVPRIVGVNAFGLSGTNAHVVLTSPPASLTEAATEPRAGGSAAGEATAGGSAAGEPTAGEPTAGEATAAEPRATEPTAAEPTASRAAIPVLVVSGPTPMALASQAAAYRDRFRDSDPAELSDLLYSASVRRTHHDYRLAVVGQTAADLAEAIDAHLAGQAGNGTAVGDTLGRPARIVHVFSGQGSQWPGMGMELYRTEPLVRETIGECDSLIREIAGWSVLEEIGRTKRSRLMETQIAQPTVFALQLALTRLWTSWGLAPDAVLGHSMGEIAAACVAGAIGVPDATRLIVHRGRLMQQATGSGRMTAVELPAEEVRAALESRGGDVCVATVNGPRSVVIAGGPEPMEWAVTRLQGAGATCMPLGVDYAFHSPAVRKYGDELEEVVADLTPAVPALPLLSSVDPEAEEPITDAAYWGRNVRDAVLFWPAVDRLLAKEDAVFVEIGPHPTLTRPLRAALAHRERSGLAVSSLARGKSAPETLAAGLASLYPVGIPVNWTAVHGAGRRYVGLPPLRLAGDSYWLAGVERGRQGGSLGAGRLHAEVRLFDDEGRLVAEVGGVAEDAERHGTKAAGGSAAQPAVSAGPGGGDRAQAAPGRADRAQPAPGHAQPAPGRVGRAQAADMVSAAVAEILGHEPAKRISRVRGFYELGLDSFTVVELIKRLQADFGVELEASAGIEHPTIDRMADHLVAAAAAQAAEEPQAEAPAVVAGETATRRDLREPDGRPEPIAIVGMSCRLPGASNLHEYWTLLCDGVDATRDVPETRWDAEEMLADGQVGPGTAVTRRGAFLDGIDQFDNAFFRVSAREARSMDPQQRLFLEVAWEALEDAGLSADSLRGGKTGLFVGMNTTDYQELVTRHADNVDLYYGTGNSFSGTAGRLSYFLDVRGPSLAVDTACSSSLVAVHLACQSLRTGECGVALAGGSNVMVTPTVYLAMSAAGALAPDGRCKTFAAAADGYGRGEGAGTVVLKTLSRALADGDRVYAVIKGSAVNHNGASGGLTVPSAEAQEEVIKAAMAQGGVANEAVDYVEAHGTGTSLGDAVELAALDRALGAGRPGNPLLVGSVKTNIGHLEAAAGVAGLIKTVLALRHGEIPAHLHFEEPTGQVAWDKIAVKVAGQRTPWPESPGGRPRVAGVSAFGFTGTNSHVVLTGPPASEPPESPPTRQRAFALAVSGASEPALHGAAQRLRTHLETLDGGAVSDVCHSSARRAHLEHRLVVVGESRAELLERLGVVSEPGAGAADEGVQLGVARVGEPARFALVYGESLADLPWSHFDAEEPAFRAALDALDAEAEAMLGRSVRTALLDRGGDPLALVAAQIALTALWRDHGVVPDALVGRGVGEIAATYAADLLSPRDAMLAATGEHDMRFSVEPAPNLYLASLTRAGAKPAAWVPPSSTGSQSSDPELARRLSAAGIESMLDVGFGATAAELAESYPDGPSVLAVAAAPQIDSLVRAAAKLHATGSSVDWTALLAGRGRLVSLPTYPWQHRRHWIDVPALPVTDADAGAGVHPSLGVPLTPSDAPDTRYYPIRVADRAARQVAAPRTAELFCAAGGDLLGTGPIRLRGFDLAGPLTDAADLASGTGAQLVAHRVGAGWSLRLTAGGAPGRSGALVAAAKADRSTRPPEVDVADLHARLGKQVAGGTGPGDEPISDVAGPDLIEVCQDARGRERLATVRLEPGGPNRPVLPAGLLAAGVRLLASCAVRHGGERFVISGIDDVQAFEAPAEQAVLHATATAADAGDVRVLNGDGRVLADLKGVRFAPAEDLIVDEAKRDRISERLYRVEWRRIPDDKPRDAQPDCRWLVWPATSAAEAAAAGLTEALRRAGAETVAVRPDAGDVADLIAEHGRTHGVALVTAESGVGDEAGSGSGAVDAGSIAAAALRAARAVQTVAQPAAAPRLWIVTRGAQDPTGSALPDEEQAAAWGLGRVLAMESPETRGGMVDMDPGTGAQVPPAANEFDAVAARILPLPGAGSVEDELCLRGGAWYAPRLVHGGAPPRSLAPLRCGERKWYVVAGGSRGANRPILDWLTSHGARRVLLILPDGPSDDIPDDMGDEASMAAPPLSAEVELRAARISASDPEGDLDTATDGAPIGAVVVTPAPASIRPLDETEPRHLAADLATADLVRRLDRAVRGRPLEFFCVIGSAAASWGSVGMAARAATEGLLDALGAARAAAGEPIQSIRWMPREDTGELGRRDRMLMEDSGLTPLAAEDVAEALDVLVRAGYSDTCVARIDQHRYAAVCRGRLDRGFLEQLSRAGGPAAADGTAQGAGRTPFAAELVGLVPGLRDERMLDFVLGHVIEVLGEAADKEVDPDQGFFELGMDSIMSLALKTRLDRGLGGELPATLAFEFPTTRALAQHLLQEVTQAAGGEVDASDARRVDARVTDVDAPAENEEDIFDGLSDDELRDRLMESLASSESLLGEEH